MTQGDEIEAGALIGGRYRLRVRVGVGAFGAVWLAHDEDANRQVAVKFLVELEESAQRRFEREAGTLARLQHPGLLRALDFGFVSADLPFLVTEFIEGETLAEWIERPRTIPEIRSVLIGLAEALREAHRAGVVHRDLKPANVIIRGGTPPTPCILDFGLARMFGRRQTDITKTGEVLGTPGYMSPEQLRGERAVGAATDMYALGAILFAMLDRRPPFEADTPLGVCMAHMVEPVPPVQRVDAGELGDLARALLDKSPSRRPTATAVINQLARRSTRELPTSSPHTSLGVIAAVLVLLVAVLGGVAFLIVDEQSEDKKVVRRPPAQRVSGRTQLPPATAPDAGPMLDSADPAPGCRGMEELKPGLRRLGFLGDGPLVHIPKNYSPSREYPVIVFFHDAFQEPRVAAKNLDYAASGIDEYVIVFPRGDPELLLGTHWTDIDVVRSAADVLSIVASSVCVEEEPYLFGHARGGNAVELLHRCLGRPVAAIATFAHRLSSSKPLECEQQDVPGVPTLAIFAMDDPLAPPDKKKGCDGGGFTRLPNQIRLMRKRNDCRRAADEASGLCEVLDCAVPLEVCEVPGTRQWRADYSDLGRRGVDAHGCGEFEPTKFPVTQKMLDFFGEVRRARASEQPLQNP